MGDGRWGCHVCKKTCVPDVMRHHIGQHILHGHVGSAVCGWCGGTCTCNTFLERSHRKQGIWFYKPKSTCSYFWPLRSIPNQSTAKKPCTNYVVHCDVCTECVWKYHLEDHYKERHPTHEVPVDKIPGEEEIERVKTMECNN